MKLKTKLLTTLTPVLTLTGVAPIITLTSCGDGTKNIELNVTKGKHVKAYSTTGELKTKKTFLITVVFEDGWQKLDTAKTTISAGNKKLVLGTDYEINNPFQIKILADKVIESNVNVTLEAAATAVGFTHTFSSTTVKSYEGFILSEVDQKITKNDLKIKVLKGDEKYYDVEFGSSSGQAQIFQKGKDITSSFINNGLTITKDMIIDPKTGGKEVSSLGLTFNVEMDTIKTTGQVIGAFAGAHVESIQAVEPEDLKVRTEPYELEAKVNEGAYSWATFELFDTAETVATLEGNQLTVVGTGKISIKTTSLFSPEIYSTCSWTVTE